MVRYLPLKLSVTILQYWLTIQILRGNWHIINPATHYYNCFGGLWQHGIYYTRLISIRGRVFQPIQPNGRRIHSLRQTAPRGIRACPSLCPFFVLLINLNPDLLQQTSPEEIINLPSWSWKMCQAFPTLYCSQRGHRKTYLCMPVTESVHSECYRRVVG